MARGNERVDLGYGRSGAFQNHYDFLRERF